MRHLGWRAPLAAALLLGALPATRAASRAVLRADDAASLPLTAPAPRADADPGAAVFLTPSIRTGAVALTLRERATPQLRRVAGGWRLDGDAGTLEIAARLPRSSGALWRAFGISGALPHGGAVRLERADGGAWHPIGAEEPVERDPIGAFEVGPIWTAEPTVRVRIRLRRDASAHGQVTLRDLHIDLLPAAFQPSIDGPAFSAPGIRASAALPGAAVIASPLNAALEIGRAGTPPAADPSAAVISRIAWGSPDGEGSPRWVPFFEEPFHIVIHHTDAPPGPNGPAGDLRAIWSFHTFTRGWGDIGYNYVIDTSGNVYEGRAGGDLSAGAHTHNFNAGALGISLIGSYQYATPPAPMLRTLQALIIRLANRYGIDTRAVVSQRGLPFRALAGHRDFNLTTCPGDQVYNRLPGLRDAVARAVRSDAAPAGAGTLFVTGGAPGTALLRVRNTGTTTWNGRFTLRRSGVAIDLPEAYALPETPPGTIATIPLFLPALPIGATAGTRWQLADGGGIASGASFPVTLHALAPGAPIPALPTATAPPIQATPTAVATARTRPSATATARATARPRRVATVAPTATHTPRPTRVASATPPSSFTPTAVDTITPVPTSTQPPPTATASVSATASGTPSPSATASVTPLAFFVPTAHAGFGSMARESGRAPLARTIGMPARAVAVRRGAVDDGAALPLSTRWYLADGISDYYNRETIALLNPGTEPAHVVTTLVRGDGRRVYAVSEVPPQGRATLDAGLAAGETDLLAAIVESTAPIAAERTLHHASSDVEGTGAALLPAVSQPAPHWYLPRLPIARDERERISILNPSVAPVTVRVRAVRGGRLEPVADATIAGLHVASVSLPDAVTSATVDLAPGAGSGVVVSGHTIYGDHSRGYTVVPGLSTLAASAYFPGASGGASDTVMLLNPGESAARVTLIGVDPSGAPVAAQRIVVPPGGQAVAGLKGDGMGRRATLRLESTAPVAASFVGMLAASGETSVAAVYRGSVSVGPGAPGRRVVFAEGDTRAGLSAPRVTLVVTDPGPAPAHLTVAALATGGRRTERTLTVEPHATIRVDINALGLAREQGLVLRSDTPVVALRTVDSNAGAERLASYGSAD